MLVCDKCSARIPPESRFCPQCADPVTEEDRPASESSVSSEGVPIIKVEFGYSSSPRYTDAVELAERIPSCTTSGGGTSQRHAVELEATEVRLAVSLWELVSNWKQSRLTINGQRITKKDLTYGPLGCFQKRQESFKPEGYCLGLDEYRQNIWGCHQLGLQLGGWRDSWFTWGSFDEDGKWNWDRDRLRHELEKGVHEYKYCPVLNTTEVWNTLDRLPDGVNPSTNRNWNYVKEWQRDGEVPIGVVPTLAMAKKLAAKVGEPVWESNSSLEHADSKLEDYSKSYDIDIRPRQTAAKVTPEAKSGCVIVAVSLGVGGAVVALIGSWLL